MALIDVMKRSFKFPMQVDEETGLVPFYADTDDEQLRHASDIIKQKILIGKYEVIFEFEDGSEVADLVFEPDSEYPENAIGYFINEAMKNENRLEIEEADVERKRNNGELIIKVPYSITSTSKGSIAEVE